MSPAEGGDGVEKSLQVALRKTVEGGNVLGSVTNAADAWMQVTPIQLNVEAEKTRLLLQCTAGAENKISSTLSDAGDGR